MSEQSPPQTQFIDTSKQVLYPIVNKVVKNYFTPENLSSLKKMLKTLHKIAIAVEDKEIELADITCQTQEEYLCLIEFRKRFNAYQKKLSEKSMKKLFH